MATTDQGVYYPSPGDAYQPPADMQSLAESLGARIIAPVATEAARDAVNAQVSTYPLFVFREDTGQVEYTADGVAWRTVLTDANVQSWTGAGVFSALASGVTVLAASATAITVGGATSINLSAKLSGAPYGSGSGLSILVANVVDALDPAYDAPVQFGHSTNMGSGLISSSGAIRMHWGSFAGSGTTTYSISASYGKTA